MNQKRLLYIMGIDWDWIYQRPQIFAEKLAQNYNVTILFPRSIIKGKWKKPVIPLIKSRILWTIPYQEKNVIIGRISRWLNKRLFSDIDKFSYVYVGYPMYGRYIPQNYQGKIIYDCMDNFEALYPDLKRVEKILVQEVDLVKRCNLLIVSSEELGRKMDAIAGQKKSILIRNAASIGGLCPIKSAEKKENYSICYIGTISKWLDYELLLESVKKLQNVKYHLIGPIVEKRDNSNLIYHDTIAHDKLSMAVAEYDCLIMPFKVNDIVKYVNPVKLYEYIAFGKCIISVYYPEVEVFKDFVYFYHNIDEYVELLRKLEESGFPPKYNAEQQRAFLYENTWENRYEMLQDKIMAMEEENED